MANDFEVRGHVLEDFTDILPEALLGPMGFLDDLVFGVFVLNRILRETDPSILREHWSGSEDLLASIQRVLGPGPSVVHLVRLPT